MRYLLALCAALMCAFPSYAQDEFVGGELWKALPSGEEEKPKPYTPPEPSTIEGGLLPVGPDPRELEGDIIGLQAEIAKYKHIAANTAGDQKKAAQDQVRLLEEQLRKAQQATRKVRTEREEKAEEQRHRPGLGAGLTPAPSEEEKEDGPTEYSKDVDKINKLQAQINEMEKKLRKAAGDRKKALEDQKKVFERQLDEIHEKYKDKPEGMKPGGKTIPPLGAMAAPTVTLNQVTQVI